MVLCGLELALVEHEFGSLILRVHLLQRKWHKARSDILCIWSFKHVYIERGVITPHFLTHSFQHIFYNWMELSDLIKLYEFHILCGRTYFQSSETKRKFGRVGIYRHGMSSKKQQRVAFASKCKRRIMEGWEAQTKHSIYNIIFKQS